MASNTRAGRGGRANQDVPPPPDPNMTQMLRLIMEDRQAAREAQQANTAALQQIVANFNPQPNAGGAPRSALRSFQDTDPPRFSKPVQPLDADDWLRTIQNNLEVAEVPENQKVLFATHFLTGQARTWWETTKAHLPANEVLAWEDFKTRFRKVYIPAGLLKRKRDEFRQLKQNNKSVMEYLDQFTDLSRYAPDDVDTEEKKKEKFLEGLHHELQIVLVALTFDTLESLVDAAIQMETKRKAAEDNRKRRFQYQSGPSNSPNVRARVPMPAPPRPAPRP